MLLTWEFSSLVIPAITLELLILDKTFKCSAKSYLQVVSVLLQISNCP